MLYQLPSSMPSATVQGNFKIRGKVFEAINFAIKQVNETPFKVNTLYLPIEALVLLNQDKGSLLLLQSIQQIYKLRIVSVNGLIPIIACYIPQELAPPEAFIGFPTSFNRELPDSLFCVIPSDPQLTQTG